MPSEGTDVVETVEVKSQAKKFCAVEERGDTSKPRLITSKTERFAHFHSLHFYFLFVELITLRIFANFNMSEPKFK